MTTARRILIIDDEQGIRAALGQLLEFEGYEVRAVGNAVDGLAEYAKQRPDLVFLDVKMAGIDGVEALKKIKEADPSAIVVMISGHATIQTAVEATQLGAYDILEKPLDTIAFSSRSETRSSISISTKKTRDSKKRFSRATKLSESRTAFAR
jgi:DNA-binding NtrC family response regulator